MSEHRRTVALQYRFFAAHVVRARRVGASLVRVTFGGADLTASAASTVGG